MSKYNMDDERFRRAVFVAKQHPDGIGLLDAIAHYSRGDPFRVDETETANVDAVGPRAERAPHSRGDTHGD